MVLYNAIWQQFHSQQLQRMTCVAGGVVRQKVVQHGISHPCTVCMQPMNSYHSGSPMQPPTKTNHHCDGVPCQHPQKFRTAESLGTKLIPSWRFSNPAFCRFQYCKRQKAGHGLGMRLGYLNLVVNFYTYMALLAKYSCIILDQI